MRYEKVCVEVVAKFSADGGMRPLEISFEDARYPITRIRFAEHAPARVGAVLPVRYTCVIGGKDRYLYFEPEELRWFVEKKIE